MARHYRKLEGGDDDVEGAAALSLSIVSLRLVRSRTGQALALKSRMVMRPSPRDRFVRTSCEATEEWSQRMRRGVDVEEN
jgi:hypothetical protein